MKILLSTLLTVLLLSNCAKSEKDEISKLISFYLKDEFNIDLIKDSTFIFFLKNGGCGPCESETFRFISILLKNQKYNSNHYIIHCRIKYPIIEELLINRKNVILLYDKLFLMDSYGLISNQDFFIQTDENKNARYYGILNKETIPQLIEKYK
jgi:hypothetical protein